MKRWLRYFAPELTGFVVANLAGMGIAWCALTAHWIALVPAITVTIVSTLASIGSLAGDGPIRRENERRDRLLEARAKTMRVTPEERQLLEEMRKP